MTNESNDKRYQVEPGSLIEGKYRVERLIGKGGMGRIVAARHLQLDERVALKFLIAPEERGEEFRARFLREAQVTAKLRGAHVVRILDFGVTEQGDPFIVMEYLEGINLKEFLKDMGPLPIDVAVDFAVQICNGLAEAHRSEVVHRDLKPANLFLTNHVDGGDLIKILDFGVSKLRTFAAMETELTEAGAMIGSPKYMSIEQLSQAREVDQRADVWSLGAITFQMLTGRPPFEGNNTAAICLAIMSGEGPPSIQDLRPEVPAALGAAVKRCLEHDLDKRTPNVAIFAKELVEASQIEALWGAAKAVEDVLVQQKGLSTSGQVRAFGKSGSFTSASGRHRAVSLSDDSGSKRTQDSAATSGVMTGNASSKRKGFFVAIAALVLVGGIAGAIALSGGTEHSVSPDPSASFLDSMDAPIHDSSITKALADVTEDVTDAAQDAAEDAPDAQKDGAEKDKVKAPKVRGPRVAPPATKPPSETAPTPTPKKTTDPFGSRH